MGEVSNDGKQVSSWFRGELWAY